MRILRLFVFVLAFSLCVTSALRSERSEALFPALAAYGTLEVILIGSGFAAAAGIITMQQNRAFKAQVAALTQKMQEATSDSVQSIADQVRELYKNFTSATKKAGPTAKPIEPAKDADCPAGLNEDPRKCCSEWFKRTDSGDSGPGLGFLLAQVGKMAFQVFKFGTNEVRCCIEWDGQHARFEVFTPGGEGKYSKVSGQAYTHQGEFSCKNSEDPCRATHQGKADNTGKHAPRGGCEEKLSSGGGNSGRSGGPSDATR